ncbi:hypothetical protein ABZP36_034070 [Zizania latifolia]
MMRVPFRRLPHRAAAGGEEALKMSVATGEYPCPVSPPYPAASKEVELRRAITASARSGAYSSAAVVFEDECIVVVDKPAGVYCDALLSALPSSAAASGNLNVYLVELQVVIAVRDYASEVLTVRGW